MDEMLTAVRGPHTTVGIATSHAGEVLQGAVRNGNRTHRLLLSLPAPALWTRAEIIPTAGRPLTVEPGWATKAHRAATRLLTRLGMGIPEVAIRLTTNIPAGKGCGSSTADILATIRALLRYMGVSMSEEAIAGLIVDVEEASDGSVLSWPALFRHREGTVEEYLPRGFPGLQVLVIDAQPGRTLNTVSMPRASYSDQELRYFQFLVGELRRAFQERDPQVLGAVATASARVSQRFLPKPHLEGLIDLVAGEAGYGLCVSHSGTVVAALLPAECAAAAAVRLARATTRLGMRVITRYSLDAPHGVSSAPGSPTRRTASCLGPLVASLQASRLREYAGD